MDVSQFKVFGERNTGTNWVENILMKNYDLDVVNHRGILGRETTPEQRALIRSVGGREGHLMRERISDAIFERHGEAFFGWKHACVKTGELERNPSFKETAFILIVKHPLSFVKSLHERPYHGLTTVPRSLNSFAQSPWLTVWGDRISEPLLKSPVEFWNHKVGSYYGFLAKHSNGRIFTYEELLADLSSFFDGIEETFGLAAKTREPVTDSTKSSKLSTAEYRMKYLDRDSAADYSPATIAFFRNKIDSELAERLGYEF